MSELPHQKRQAILSDHWQIGKRFIPPFTHTFAGLQEVKWIDVPLPELLWLGLLNHRYGLTRGAELGLSVARAAAAASAPEKVWFAPISGYGKITSEQRQVVMQTLKAETNLPDLKSALSALVALYPECPLAFLFEGEVPEGDLRDRLSQLKVVLTDLFDKTTNAATFMQANGVYIAFVTDMLVVSPETSLANFPSVFDYPHSEDAKRIAASVRATINGFFGTAYDNSSSWPSYFWNRGLEIDQCVLGTKSTDE